VERNNGHRPFTEAAMYRIASRAKDQYWRIYYKANNGLTCGNCSQTQRRKVGYTVIARRLSNWNTYQSLSLGKMGS
jgi:hypothetical protein